MGSAITGVGRRRGGQSGQNLERLRPLEPAKHRTSKRQMTCDAPPPDASVRHLGALLLLSAVTRPGALKPQLVAVVNLA